jgi:hypothetical protein
VKHIAYALVNRPIMANTVAREIGVARPRGPQQLRASSCHVVSCRVVLGVNDDLFSL